MQKINDKERMEDKERMSTKFEKGLLEQIRALLDNLEGALDAKDPDLTREITLKEAERRYKNNPKIIIFPLDKRGIYENKTK